MLVRIRIFTSRKTDSFRQQHRFERIGLDEKLAKHGAKQGDEVRILGFEFTYEGETEDDYTELDESVELLDEAEDEEE